MNTTYRVCPQCSAQNSSQNTTCDFCNASLEALPEVTASSGWSYLVTDAEKQIKTSRNVLFVLAAANLVAGLINYLQFESPRVFLIRIVGGVVYGILSLVLNLRTVVTVCTIAAVLLSLDLVASIVFAHPAGLEFFTAPIVKGLFIAAMLRGRRAAQVISQS
jgi:hypothetical protein